MISRANGSEGDEPLAPRLEESGSEPLASAPFEARGQVKDCERETRPPRLERARGSSPPYPCVASSHSSSESTAAAFEPALELHARLSEGPVVELHAGASKGSTLELLVGGLPGAGDDAAAAAKIVDARGQADRHP